MNTNKFYKGVFWIPGEDDNSKFGLLKFFDGRAEVDLFDSFDLDPQNMSSKKRKDICCIYGKLSNNLYCKLYKCKLSFTGIAFTETTIQFSYLFYSSNQKLTTNNLNFSKIEFKLNTLFHWADANSIEFFHFDSSNVGLNYKKPPEVDLIFSNQNYELELLHKSSIPVTTNQKKMEIEQDTNLILTLKPNDEDFIKSFDIVDKIHDLFILFNADKVQLDNTFQLYTLGKEDFFYCYANQQRFINSKGLQNHDVGNLFTYSELIELTDIKSLFGLWFSFYNKFEYPIRLMIECLSDKTMNNQHKFMNLIYALEYLTAQDLNFELAKSYYAKSDQSIIDEIEKIIIGNNEINKINFLKSLKARLSKNRKLSEKLISFLIQLEIPILDLFGETHEIFVKKIVNTRNHFAHVNNNEPRIEMKDLHVYNVRLEAILLIIFYLKLNLSMDIITTKIKLHDRFQIM